uniref:Chemosensory protein 15 n=1 Tax=Matsumurasca onukii TaxID=2912585 RepID=A0A343WH10_MATON|nr:chemosensory protein 15 [Matsumurasca onukii]
MECTFMLLVLALLAAASAQQQYTTKFDGVDVDNILRNDRLLTSYFNCVMEVGKCSPDGTELKKRIPEALENECAKCTEKQKEGAQKVLKHLYEKKPDMFQQLEAKYDSSGKYRAKYKDRAEKELGTKIA